MLLELIHAADNPSDEVFNPQWLTKNRMQFSDSKRWEPYKGWFVSVGGPPPGLFISQRHLTPTTFPFKSFRCGAGWLSAHHGVTVHMQVCWASHCLSQEAAALRQEHLHMHRCPVRMLPLPAVWPQVWRSNTEAGMIRQAGLLPEAHVWKKWFWLKSPWVLSQAASAAAAA